MNDDYIPAFPLLDSGGLGTLQLRDAGMSLRDYFAARYMQGFIAAPDFEEKYDHVTPDDCARLAYRMADAMLKARMA